MEINYQAVTLRRGYYAITSQGKGSAALVWTLCSIFGFHGFISLKKKMLEIKVYIFMLK